MAAGRERHPVVREGVKNIFGGLDRGAREEGIHQKWILRAQHAFTAFIVYSLELDF
jgi:hypothetical protein